MPHSEKHLQSSLCAVMSQSQVARAPHPVLAVDGISLERWLHGALPESWLLGLLMSSAHMDWMRMSCGRLKSDYRYSTTLAYNTFPWPERMGNKVVRDRLASLANKVLDARPKDITLAKAYIDIAMNEDLRKAHAALDRYVDSLYGNDFSAVNRIGRLLSMYEQNVRARDLADADAKKAKKKKGSSKDVQPSLF